MMAMRYTTNVFIIAFIFVDWKKNLIWGWVKQKLITVVFVDGCAPTLGLFLAN